MTVQELDRPQREAVAPAPPKSPVPKPVIAFFAFFRNLFGRPLALSKAQQAENARRKARMREHKERFRIRCIEAEANGEPPPCAYCLEQGIVMRVFVGSKPETIPCPVCSVSEGEGNDD